MALDLFSAGRPSEWRNRLIWGDRKYVLPALLDEFVGDKLLVIHTDRKGEVSNQLWCENATILTGTEWVYRKVLQKEFEKLQPSVFEDLIALEPITVL